ncbi:8-oxoguanine deaminase [uncultured Brachyspira sp.]|uniref:8-oxoguanine deaminase n=1 Tax=uncultured Brachyspira sp. TaxID=221953 RepID=UPI00262B2036|nr:8-oxoguanine deaminase [uncultured Brachyspira sp.]
MSGLFIKNASSIVTCSENDKVYNSANILIENGVITYIGEIGEKETVIEEKNADRVIDASGYFVYPGLINTHHHLFQIFSRNLPQVQNMELFEWLTNLYEIWKNLNSEVVYYSSITAMGELLKTGCTTCFDHHYLFPNNNAEGIIDSQFRAAKDLGIRMYASRGSMDLSKKDGGLPPDSVVQPLDVILKDCQRVVEKYHDNSRYSMNMVALAPCAPFNVSEELLKQSAILARDLKVRLHTHLCETKDEEVYVKEKFNMRPLEYMESLGWVGDDVWYAHGIHFNEKELNFLADTKTGVAHCPISNMKLSSGVCNIPEMLKLGVPVGLAVDGSASNDGSNMLEEMRVCYLLHRLNSSSNAPSAYDILKMATKGGAEVLGRDDIGSLEVGKAGDLFMIDMRRLEMVGADFDPKSILCTIGWKNTADYTIVNGKVVSEKGKLTSIDEEKMYKLAYETERKYLNM